MSYRLVAAALCLLCLTACGYHLRGTTQVPVSMERTYIDTKDRQSRFFRSLRQEFISAGIDVVESPLEATATFRIDVDLTDQRVLSVSAQNVPREYEVYYTVTYALQSDGKSLIDTRTQTQVRAYTWDETQVLGKSQEELELRNALASNLVRIVMIQIASL